MQFKIETKDQYTLITPQKGIISASLAADLSVECSKQTANGCENFIINLENYTEVQKDFMEPLVLLSSSLYEEGKSFVLTNAPAEMLRILKEEDAIESLNIAPTFIEAIDIISMEILERDLFNEE